MSQAEFARWLETLPAGDPHHYELLDRFVVMEPPAGWPHGQLEAELSSRLLAFVKPRRAGRVFGSSQGFELPSGDTVEPDVSFVGASRWRAAGPRPGLLRLVPDLVVEILSPSTAAIDRGDKRRIYGRNGVREYVLVDAERRQLEQHRWLRTLPGQFDEARLVRQDEVYRSAALPGFSFRVGELFEDL